MKKENRLRKTSEFNTVYNRGKNYWNRNLVLYVYKNNRDLTRIGYSITKKIGNAVTRNKLRRRMNEVVRLNFDKMEKGYDIVLIPKRNAVDLSYQELESAIIHILSISNVLKKS